MAAAKSFRTRAPVTPAGVSTDSHLRLLTLNQITEPAFVAAWERLAAQAGEPNPFYEPWFLIPSLRQWGASERVVIKAWFTGGRLAGLMPVVRSARYYSHAVTHATGWLHANSFCGTPLIEAGQEDDFWRMLLAHFDRSPRRALFLHLPKLPADGPAYAALARVLATGARGHYVAEMENRACLQGDFSAQEYLEASMSAKKRKELRRQYNRLAEEGLLTFERVEGSEGVAAWTEEFLALESAGWKGEEGSALASSPDTIALFHQALAGAAVAGRLERLALRLDGRAIAMLANFITAPGAYSFKTAFDEAYARYSPGMLLQLENLALLERPDVQWADSCAVEGHPMIERLWRGQRRMVSCNIAIGGPLRRAVFRLLKAYETRPRPSSQTSQP
ncbi:GNAT family N-acetyltransferase [Porphyrobacter sp. AAP60]|uniref:GNAT family N-acetyltransferase n=1 Tax=Porphyrobacter sp. AAP60 TaxID=1523423 RepID=UPI0006B8D8AD|nr:GNAT family N-acetyltransferase [Porphyrobacter sp. AAP60]KPF65370.1 cellulose biosynthesis protein CelD [Porphyrobacter sp. AAP60]